MATARIFNPALNLNAFPNLNTTPPAPPKNNAIYLRDGKYDGIGRADVANAFKAFDTSGHTRLSLFFHGGLVDKASGTKSASTQYDHYKDVCFPYFFVWEAGVWEILAHHFPAIFGNTIFTALLHSTTNQVAAKAGLPETATTAHLLLAGTAPAVHPLNQSLTAAQRKAFRITQADVAKCVGEVANDQSVQHAVADVARFNLAATSDMHTLMARSPAVASGSNQYLNSALVGLVTGAYKDTVKPSSTLQDAHALFDFNLGGMFAAARAFALNTVPTILHNVAERIARGRDHGIVCTVVEEILRVAYLASFGSNIWEEMKKETEDAFGADSTTFGGTAVVEEICARVKGGTKFDVTLVGHSTGAVYIGNFLESVDAALAAIGDTTFAFDVVLMAAADTDAFERRTFGKRIRALRSFGMTDKAEQNDLLMSNDLGSDPSASILGRVYPRSLLYLISGALETYAPDIPSSAPHDLDTSDMPLVGMDRFFANTGLFDAANYPDVAAYRQVVANANGSNLFMRVLSPTTGKARGRQCGAQKHGNFPSDDLMVASLKYCFQNGIS